MEHSAGTDPPSSDRPLEVEGTLAVYAKHPDTITQRIAAYSSLSTYTLKPRPPQRIRDTYFDSRDGALRARLTALRLREVGGVTLLTLKADSEDEEDVSTRLEIESAWSPAALNRVRRELERQGIRLDDSPSQGDAVADLKEAGLVPFQQRETIRTPRDVLDPTMGPEAVAELALDVVRFFPSDVPVRWDEVEVEAKGRGDAAVVRSVLTSLRNEFPAELRPWPYPKLATGLAIQRLGKLGRLGDLVTPNGTLRLEAHAVIRAILDGETGAVL